MISTNSYRRPCPTPSLGASGMQGRVGVRFWTSAKTPGNRIAGDSDRFLG